MSHDEPCLYWTPCMYAQGHEGPCSFDLHAEVARLTAEVARLRGEVDEARQQRFDDTYRRLAEIEYPSMATRIAQLEAQLTAETAEVARLQQEKAQRHETAKQLWAEFDAAIAQCTDEMVASSDVVATFDRVAWLARKLAAGRPDLTALREALKEYDASMQPWFREIAIGAVLAAARSLVDQEP